jgi:hypothetical protein
MQVEDVIECQPLRLLEKDKPLPRGEASLLLARSGVGKSAVLINFAINEIIEGNHVLHFSAGMPSEKTHRYYQKISGDYQKNYPSADVSWEKMYHYFTVISYLDADKMIDDLDSEIETILGSTDVRPSLILVDGLDFCEEASLAKLSEVAAKHNVRLLASLRIRRKSGGDIDIDGPFGIVKAHSSHILFLEPAPESHRINLELVTDEGRKPMAVYFCPRDFIFRPA